jgi:hypothetical protein
MQAGDKRYRGTASDLPVAPQLMLPRARSQDKEKTQEKLTSELAEMESSLLQQAASFEDQNARLRALLEQKEQEIERLMANGTTYKIQQGLDFDNVSASPEYAYNAGMASGIADTNDGGADVPTRSQSTLPPLGRGAVDAAGDEDDDDDDGQRPMSV